MTGIETVEKLRFWSHKVLPLTFDDSLSYYEVLCKTTSKLNEVIDTTNECVEMVNKYDFDKVMEYVREITPGIVEESWGKERDRFKGEIDEEVEEVRGEITELDERVEGEISVYHTGNGTEHEFEGVSGGVLFDYIEGGTVKDDNGLRSSGEMGLVDLGTLSWNYLAEYNAFYSTQKYNVKGDTRNIYAKGYSYMDSTSLSSLSSASDKSVGIINVTGRYSICVKDKSYTDANAFKSAMSGVLLAYEVAQGSTPDKYALVVKERAEYGKVDLGTVNWYEYGGAYYTDNLQNNIANYLNVYIKEYTRANVPNIASMPDNSYYVNPDNKLVAIKDSRYTTVSAFKSAMQNVILTYQQNSNATDNLTIIPLSTPLNRVHGLYDEIVKQNGKWGVLRKFGYTDLSVCVWNLINNEYWRTSQIANIRLSASWSDIPNYIVAENYQPNAYGLEGIGVAPNEALVSVNNGSTTEKPSGKFIYELATPYFEPFDDQSVMYQLESYDTKTYVTTGEGLARFSVAYGKSELVGVALEKDVPKVVNLPGNMICEEWNSTNSYGVGDYVRYDNRLWKSLMANSGVKPSASVYWGETTICSELKTLFSLV